MNARPRRVGLVAVPQKPTATLAAQAAAAIRDAGVHAWVAPAWDAPEVAADLSGTDLVFSFGGDGTLIQGARILAGLDVASVPIVGVNFGKMGFLAEFEPEELLPGLPALLAGDFWVEERITLAIEHRRDGRVLDRYLAVNEAIVGRGRVNKVVRLHTWVDGQYMTTYAADGLLVATPTGSTASNLSANGPVLPPQMKALVMVPVMPFVSFRNSLVLDAQSTVDVEVVMSPPPPYHEAILSVDGGTSVMLDDGDRLSFTGGRPRCRFARIRPRHYFHAVLVPKLQRAPLLPPLPPDTPSPIAEALDSP